MHIIKTKLMMVILVIILSSAFFWIITNRFMQSSQAGEKQLGVSFEHKQINVTWHEGKMLRVPIDILITANPKWQITGASVVVNYDPKYLEYVDDQETFVSNDCKKAGFGLNRRLRVLHDESRDGQIVISRVVDPQLQMSNLPKGRICWGTIVFVVLQPGTTSVSFESLDLSGWEIVGPSNTYSPRFQEPQMSVINII